MFIENPHKKETYSFRVKPELLKNIKLYAKATEQTVPEILNNLIEEKTKGLHLTNDYLENSTFSGIEISLPPLMEMYNNGTYYKEYEECKRVFYIPAICVPKCNDGSAGFNLSK